MACVRFMVLALALLAAPAAALMTSSEEASMMQNMSLASAVKAVGQIKDPEIKALIQMSMGEVTHHGKGHLRSSGKALEPTGYSGVEGATKKLNEMIVESEQKLDLEEIKCQMFDEEQRAIMEETRQDIATYNAIAASARAAILQAMTTIEVIETKLPELNRVLQLSVEKCATDLSALRGQLQIVEGDIEIMGLIIDMTKCDTSSLLQCRHKKGQKTLSFLTLGHRSIRTKIAQLQSKNAREGVQKALASIAQPNATAASMEVDLEPPEEKQLAKCTVAGSPNCPLLRDRFIDIQGGIIDKRDELKRKIAQLEADCALTEANIRSQIADFEAKLKKAQTHLAESTETLNDAMEQSRLKQQQLAKTYHEWMVMMMRCKETIFGLKTEICGLKKIRQEIIKIDGSGGTTFIQDCEVSDWIETECSVTCGGGQKKVFRNILVQSVGGAACPPLEMMQQCSGETCPTDCVVSPWSGFSDCSAKCGGGIQMRSRRILQEPLHGGKQCGATSENRECGVESCDKDCELSAWTGWSGCSKECDGGFQTKVRTVIAEAEGQGTCPTEDSELRIEEKPCNVHACEPEGATLMCESKIDVTILLDGSASLGQEGWEATKKAGDLLVKAFKGGENTSQVGVLLFSGPSTWSQFHTCNAGQQNSLEDCGLSWVSHYTQDTDALAASVLALEWPAASTFTSMALATAEQELAQGRADAAALVIVITDGRPISVTGTFQAAHRLREKARLMWVSVGNFKEVEDMKEWASRPVRDNFLELDDFATLEDPETISKIIADSCPMVD